MQVEDKEQKPRPAKKHVPPGPGLKVALFVALMRRLDSQKDQLSDEQARFVQAALHRYENEPAGVVKTRLNVSKPKKKKTSGHTGRPAPHPAPSTIPGHDSDFVDRMMKAENEDVVIAAAQGLSDADAERLAAEQGFRSAGPQVAREKLVETILHLRQIERIVGAGKKEIEGEEQPGGGDKPPP